jgi:hypothetical protein
MLCVNRPLLALIKDCLLKNDLVSPAHFYAFEASGLVAKRHVFQLYMAGRFSVGVWEERDITVRTVMTYNYLFGHVMRFRMVFYQIYPL